MAIIKTVWRVRHPISFWICPRKPWRRLIWNDKRHSYLHPWNPPTKIRAFIGRRCVVRYVKWMKGSPQRRGGRQGEAGCLKIEDRRKIKGRLSIDRWTIVGWREGRRRDDLHLHLHKPLHPSQAAAAPVAGGGSEPHAALNQSEPRPPQSTLPPAALSSSQMMPCEKIN